jgi:succinate-acetate transporter protein
MHGLWGSFWIGYGILNLMFAMGRISPPAGRFPEMGYWFIVAAAITWAGAGAAGAANKAVATTLTFLAAGSTAAAIGNLGGVEWLTILGGYLFMVAAVCAWYTATGLMVNDTYGREVWKLGVTQNVRQLFPVTSGMGETGVIRGQA